MVSMSSPSCLVSTISVLSLSSSLVKSAGATLTAGWLRPLPRWWSRPLRWSLREAWKHTRNHARSQDMAVRRGLHAVCPIFLLLFSTSQRSGTWLPIIFFAKVKRANLRRSPYNLKVGSHISTNCMDPRFSQGLLSWKLMKGKTFLKGSIAAAPRNTAERRHSKQNRRRYPSTFIECFARLVLRNPHCVHLTSRMT